MELHDGPADLGGRFGGSGGIFRVSGAGTLVGLDVPGAAKNMEIKPYGIGGVTTEANAASLDPNPRNDNRGHGEFGVDVKYGITQNLTADFTYNTDFAQVEVDEQQVNLTRFSLFFPEKREFFLEGRGIFNFARGSFGGPGGGGGVAHSAGAVPRPSSTAAGSDSRRVRSCRSSAAAA